MDSTTLGRSRDAIPKWTPFTLDRRTTMVWNNQPRVADDPFREERLARIAAKVTQASA